MEPTLFPHLFGIHLSPGPLPFINRWMAGRQAWVKSARALEKGSPIRRWERHLRRAVRAMAYPQEALAWFEWLDSPLGKLVHERDADLAFKPFRNFQSIRWNLAQRIKVVHYSLEQGGVLRDSLLRNEGVHVATLRLRSGKEIPINLGIHPRFRQEGLFVLFLGREGKDSWISLMAFALASEGGLCCTVGCVQGMKDGAERTRELTKELHGLRPKALMVFMAQVIATTLGAESIRGIGSHIQPTYNRLNLGIHVDSEPSFDYDALWAEAGGEQAPDGWFDLPLKPRRRGEADIKPNKRSMYSKRYSMLDELANQLRRSFLA